MKKRSWDELMTARGEDMERAMFQLYQWLSDREAGAMFTPESVIISRKLAHLVIVRIDEAGGVYPALLDAVREFEAVERREEKIRG